jgi:hypothetical protein
MAAIAAAGDEAAGDASSAPTNAEAAFTNPFYYAG